LCQINTTVGDIKGNVKKILKQIALAKEKQADIVTFLELAISGYPPEDLLLRPKFLRDNQEAVERIVQESDGMTAIVGFPDVRNGHVYNAATIIHRGKLVDVYHKLELPNYGVFDEKRYFLPGDAPLFFDMGGVRFMVTICEDIWIENGMVERSAKENHVRVVLNISSSPFHAGKFAERQKIIARFARNTGAMVFYTNLVGGQDELVFDGGSLVVNLNREKIASARRFQEDLLLWDLETDRLSPHPPPSELYPRHGKYYALQTDNQPGRHPLLPQHLPELGELEEIYQALVLGTKDYVFKNGFKKVIIGLSGGIDSALTAEIAVDALGHENVIGVTMPSDYTSAETLADARLMAENLRISLLTIPINRIYAAYLISLKDSFGDGEPGVEYENIQARIRGNLLMALSNRFGWLVLTTGNKSEMAVGYCTLYGDMAGGFAVINDLPKTRVYEDETEKMKGSKKGRFF
jgi:NAD+ synthase (glutamine-hydrolysing)